ncbi:hypothetical protein [Aestuariispira insulae]|uniref:Uncharacterized protein n=1 Tax=Aestuariispira insulae TaxID=1461337 RepID=A0A3D9HXE2_9PROT|nr:hypothetical protein [Aestuariispira insulae]RED54172.1 hypothetical protein DFP90_101975 [Aestuariispira insulae]
MTPSLEAVLYSSPTVSLNINKLSKELDSGERMFRNETMNATVIFKYPNFDTTQNNIFTDKDIPTGLEAVRTAIYIPKDAQDMPLGGYGIFLDDPLMPEHLKRHVGLDLENEDTQPDRKTLDVLQKIPSLDPFLLNESFKLASITINPNYISITENETAAIRHLIGNKVEPIIAKALNVEQGVGTSSKTQEFVDAIWNPSNSTARIFIQAFGIKESEAPMVFEAWKGITFFYNEFANSRSDIARMMDWLVSDDSLPSEYLRMGRSEKETVQMMRKSIIERIQNVINNNTSVFRNYETSYRRFIQKDDPTNFRRFLKKASQFYWKIGACNGVLAQCAITWQRYHERSGGKRLDYEMLQRLFKICEAILRARTQDSGASALE